MKEGALAECERPFRMEVVGFYVSGEFVGLPDVVTVQERNNLALCLANACISGTCRSAVGLLDQSDFLDQRSQRVMGGRSIEPSSIITIS